MSPTVQLCGLQHPVAVVVGETCFVRLDFGQDMGVDPTLHPEQILSGRTDPPEPIWAVPSILLLQLEDVVRFCPVLSANRPM